MRFERFNPNPDGRNVGDCTIRAISKALGKDWDATYWGLAVEGNFLHDMPSANAVWGSYLRRNGFYRDLTPDGITVRQFADQHPTGTYVLALSGHVVCVVDGVLYDTWDSSSEIVLYYWTRR